MGDAVDSLSFATAASNEARAEEVVEAVNGTAASSAPKASRGVILVGTRDAGDLGRTKTGTGLQAWAEATSEDEEACASRGRNRGTPAAQGTPLVGATETGDMHIVEEGNWKSSTAQVLEVDIPWRGESACLRSGSSLDAVYQLEVAPFLKCACSTRYESASPCLAFGRWGQLLTRRLSVALFRPKILANSNLEKEIEGP